MKNIIDAEIRIKIVGVGGAGCNAVQRIHNTTRQDLDLIAINTDIQALKRIKNIPTFAVGPTTTNGIGSGGNADVGRKAIRESYAQMMQLLENTDMVFIAAGMGGGTGTGAAPIIAEIAKKHGALTVAVVTRPFSFEGTKRLELADRGLLQLQKKVDTLIVVENDQLFLSLDGKLSLGNAFQHADEVLQQGIQGISDIITVPGLVNVDFADIRTVMGNAGRSFMAIGEGKGKYAATEAVYAALSNPLFNAPIKGSTSILFNIKGGKDLTLDQVNEVSEIISDASQSRAQIIFGFVQHPKWNKRVSITLVATGAPEDTENEPHLDKEILGTRAFEPQQPSAVTTLSQTNGYGHTTTSFNMKKMLM